MKLFYQLLISLIFVFPSLLSGQDDVLPCGTEVSDEDLAAFLAIKEQLKTQEESNMAQTRAMIEVPVQIHSIRQGDGRGGILFQDATNALIKANEAYADAGLYFIPCGPINFIDSDEWYNMDKSDASAITGAHYEPNSINLYLTNSIIGSSGGTIGGFAPLPYSSRTRPNYVFATNRSAAGGASTISHEFGHFFGLYHTHGNTVACGRTEELVDGSNCDDAGDYICDTPADPGLNCEDDTEVSNCVYVGTARDTNGMEFMPDVTNFMSYAPWSCRYTFSPDQLNRIATVRDNYRADLDCNEAPSCDISLFSEVVAIQQDAATLLYGGVFGAESFKIEIREVNGVWEELPSIPYTETLVSLSGLQPCTDYEVRIQANCYVGVDGAYQVATFRTRGCVENCSVLRNLELDRSYHTAIALSWRAGGPKYQARARKVGESKWVEYPWGVEANTVVDYLEPGNTYFIQVRKECSSGEISAWSDQLEATTLDDQEDYCYSYGYAVENWIAGFEIANFSHEERSYGYGDFTSEVIGLEADRSFDVTLLPGSTDAESSDVYWQIWVDLDGNGEFTADENWLQESGNNQEALDVSLTVGDQVSMGDYRLRIAMSQLADEMSCETSEAQREIKDFTLNIGTLTSTINLNEQAQVDIYPNPSNGRLYLDYSKVKSSDLQFELWGADGKKISINSDCSGQSQCEMNLEYLPSGIYTYRIIGDELLQTGRLLLQK